MLPAPRSQDMQWGACGRFRLGRSHCGLSMRAAASAEPVEQMRVGVVVVAREGAGVLFPAAPRVARRLVARTPNAMPTRETGMAITDGTGAVLGEALGGGDRRRHALSLRMSVSCASVSWRMMAGSPAISG